MHIPKPLGGYPLSLRSSDVANPRKGELLYDYINDDLKYADTKTGEVKSVAQDIYDKIIAAKLENSTVSICKNSDKVAGEEDIIPPIENRKPNSWYVSIVDREPVTDDNALL